MIGSKKGMRERIRGQEAKRVTACLSYYKKSFNCVNKAYKISSPQPYKIVP